MTRRELLTGVARSGIPVAPGLNINPRDAWGADLPPKGPLDVEDVRFMIVHHSASGTGHSAADVPGILRRFYSFHTGPGRGWNDIAYNFLIDSGGGVWEGRQGSLDGAVAGDATGGNQGYSQLVCLIGDFEVSRPTEASLESLTAVLAWLAERHQVSTGPGSEVAFASRGSNRWPDGTEVRTSPITGHRSMSRTACPGKHLNDHVMRGLMGNVHDLRAMWVATTTTTLTQVDSTTTLPTPTTSSLGPSLIDPPPGPDRGVVSTSGNSALVGVAGGLVGIGAGLVLWRRRRMR